MRGVVHTIPEKCKRCYACVRECPARAVKISGGQAVVLEDRCISCGHCVRVCSQNAKRIEDARENVFDILSEKDTHTIAILAPSFPTFFPELDPPEKLLGALRDNRFDEVMEVAFGADLVSKEYRELHKKIDKPLITSPCPAVTFWITKYIPEITTNIARIVSPMIALGRAIKWKLNPEAKIVFIGPCVAKKSEKEEPEVAGVIDEVLTFDELRKMFSTKGIDPKQAEPKDFDGPVSWKGQLYPVSSGLLQSAGITKDLEANDVVVTEGKERVESLLKSFANKEIEPKFLDVLFCEGCVNGPFALSYHKKFSNRDHVLKYYRRRMENFNKDDWEKWMHYFEDIDMSRTFTEHKAKLPVPSEEQIKQKLRDMGKETETDELNCGSCGYSTCREHAIAVLQGLAESEMCLPNTIYELEGAIDEVKKSHKKLQEAQQQIFQNEKMAAMGQLAAGVAHEVNNPLGTVLLYTHMMKEALCDDPEKVQDLDVVIKETERCKNIVSGLLNFSRQSRLNLESTELNELLEEIVQPYLKDSKNEGVNIVIKKGNIPEVTLDRDQFKQVSINIIGNALDAMKGMGTLTIKTEGIKDDSHVQITYSDTGPGISEENMAKIFTPFFTTKPIGEGTGLGLSIAYGIVKMHRGNIFAKSEPGKGTDIIVEFPVGLGNSDIIFE